MIRAYTVSQIATCGPKRKCAVSLNPPAALESPALWGFAHLYFSGSRLSGERKREGLAPKPDGLDAFSFSGSVGERSLQFLHGNKEPGL